jgi:hypothetical protein
MCVGALQMGRVILLTRKLLQRVLAVFPIIKTKLYSHHQTTQIQIRMVVNTRS